MRKILISFFLIISPAYIIFSQSYVSVNLENNIYQIIDLSVQRGLCASPPGSKPYTRSQIISIINEILSAENAGGLKISERIILEKEREKYTSKIKGFDLNRGMYLSKAKLFKTDIEMNTEVGLGFDMEISQSEEFNSENFYNWGGDLWIYAYLRGDIGSNFSYSTTANFGFVKAGRRLEGYYHTYYAGFEDHDEFIDQYIPTYSEPLAYFPFTYKKRWDASVFYLDQLDSSGFQSMPEKLSGAYAFIAETTAVFFNNALLFRAGRLRREWAAMSPGSSLVFNGNARPFLALEAQFQPLSWFNISTLTGELEYFNQNGIKNSAWSSQNAFSITMLEFNIKDFLHFDLGDVVIWPKRTELGYPLPIIDSFFYQNNIGDFDNLSLFFDIKLNLYKMMNVWFSFYSDEMELNPDMGLLDRTMIAFQAGTTFIIPHLPFAFIKLTYTKIEPYCYTHNRNFVPWYNDDNGLRPVETAYINNGVGIGYYLPPNSDEVLLRFEAMPGISSKIHFQYQMIRHGADFGDSAVDGSSYLSELDPDSRNENPILKKYFLHDGAYQWFHILKGGAEYTLKKLPITVYGEAGVVFSYFTNIDGPANQGETSQYHIVDEAPYTRSTSFILMLGVKIFSDSQAIHQ
ncbi:MAG: hypothetical protein LBC27_08100 [Spirochaetaceae bacterium]|jgi:hypothetical protein|nr:hypothetical protein [Spirochaetaceae bacterium]